MQKGAPRGNVMRQQCFRVVIGCLLGLCVGLLTSCASFEAGSSNRPITGKTPVMLSGQSGSTILMLPSERQLNLQGPFIASIHMGKSPAGQVTVRGDSALVGLVGYRYQSDGTVTVQMNPHYQYPKNYSLWLDINMPRTTSLRVGQGTNATISVLNGYYFQAIAQDNSQLTLFGTVRRLDLTATDYATIDAKQVRSRTGFVKASQFAQISVIVNGGLSAWALDQSNIYYFTDPVMVAPYQVLSGSVLRMSGIAS